MPVKSMLLALAMGGCLMASDIVSWQDVEFLDRNVESGKVNKRDGMLHLDRETGVIAFTSENRLYASLLGDKIQGCTFDEKNDKLLKCEYRDARDRVRSAEFKLKGGNRTNILTQLGQELSGRVQTIGMKR